MEYDYIVVGAGSAGCVVANRLSEDPDVSVLLLEAGGEDTNMNIHNPTMWTSLLGSEVDWGYQTELEPGFADRKIACNRGKVLGGSSSINAMIYIRGNRWDYDHWNELGCPGWSFTEVLPYFLKSEHQERGESALHGIDGLLNVSDPTNVHPLLIRMVEAAVESGHSHNPDFNGECQEGAGLYQLTVKDGKRHSTAEAFLRPAQARPNLTLITQALASRILFNEARAEGISFLQDGSEQQVLARREVIICSGAINSPQLLLLSGIGPAEDLLEKGITVVRNLPGVGKNLHDHPTVTVAYTASYPPTSLPGHSIGGLFLYSSIDPKEPAPDLQFHYGPNFDEANWEVNRFDIAITQLRPQSRGQIRLRSAHPEDAPAIEFNYLAHPDDMKRMVAGVKMARKMGQATVLTKFRGEEVLPGAGISTDEEIELFIRNEGWGIWHPVGTCRMGSGGSAVVDPELKVYGIQGLRVADASVMPQIVSGNTNAPTIMIAEKAAALVRMSWR